MAEPRATLLVIEGNDQGARFDLAGTTVIGRGAKNPIRILDTEASRLHARIENTPLGWLLEDLNSSNGTFVNGQPVKTHLLESGDHIRLGRTTLVFALPKQLDSSLLNVDLIGGSSHDGHSQIVRTFSASELGQGSAGQTTSSRDQLQPTDVLRVMGNIAEQAVRPSMTMTELLERVLRMILQTVHADRGCILLIDAETGMVVPQVTLNRAVSSEQSSHVISGASSLVSQQMRMPISKTIVDYVLKTCQAVRTNDPLHDTRFDPGQSILQAGVREAICVPMQGRMALLGVIYLDLADPHRYLTGKERQETHLTDEQLRLLTAVGRQCALAIENFRYQQSLVDAERLAAIGQTIATLSHHIKNILQGVRGGSYLIDMGLKQDDHELIRKGWKLVEKNQDKIYHLVMDMLTFSKERTPRIEQTSLNEVVTDVFELMESHAAECGVKLVYEPNPRIPPSSFDPEGIHRSILNILTNAIDAAEQNDQGGVVEIVVRYHNDSDLLSVSVQDNGPGIPHSQQDKIFNVFESTKGARGTGIGLAVSRKILREHGGDIRVVSEPNQGACFVLEWPYSHETSDVEPSRTLMDQEGYSLPEETD